MWNTGRTILIINQIEYHYNQLAIKKLFIIMSSIKTLYIELTIGWSIDEMHIKKIKHWRKIDIGLFTSVLYKHINLSWKARAPSRRVSRHKSLLQEPCWFFASPNPTLLPKANYCFSLITASGRELPFL